MIKRLRGCVRVIHKKETDVWKRMESLNWREKEKLIKNNLK